MKKYLLPNSKQYKANLHTHTDVSDGTSTPEEIKNFYLSHGYSIIAYTDHEILVDHSNLSDGNFLAVTGCEYSVTESGDKPWKFKKTCHLNFLAKEPDNTTHVCFDPRALTGFVSENNIKTAKYHGDIFHREYTAECINHVIAEAKSHGFLVTLNHPWWSMEGIEAFSRYEGCFAVEVFNTTCSPIDGYYEYNPYIYDELLRMGKMVYPIAADDVHNLNPDSSFQPQALGGFNMISSPSLKYSDVLRAIENGDLYASTGPIINEIYYEDGMVTLNTEPAQAIFFRTGTRRGKYVYDLGGGTVSKASFKFEADDKYVYAMVKGTDGNWAITRPYRAEELG